MGRYGPYLHQDGREIVSDELTQNVIVHGPDGSTAILSYGDMEALRGYFRAETRAAILADLQKSGPIA